MTVDLFSLDATCPSRSVSEPEHSLAGEAFRRADGDSDPDVFNTVDPQILWTTWIKPYRLRTIKDRIDANRASSTAAKSQ